VFVNGDLEQRRGRQLKAGDRVQMGVDSAEVSDSLQAGP
jgi:ribosome-associated protein